MLRDPQQRRLAEWRDQRTRRRAELEEKTARREAEFTALISAISAQVAAEVSAAVAAALETARVGHHEGLNHAPTTTSAPTASVADDHGLDLAPATTSTTTRSVAANYDPTATSTSPAPPSVTTECLVRGGDLAVRPPTTCSMVCQGGGPSSPSAASNPAEVLEPVASPPPIPVAVAYSYSSVTGPAPHADIQLVHEDVLQPETFTGAISVPPSALAADLALTRTAATSTTAQAVLEIVAVPSTPLLADSLLADRVVNHDDLYFQSFSAVTARPLPTTPTIASTDQDTTLALESDFTTARPITCSTICAEGDTSVAASQEFTHATSIITNGEFVPGNKMLCEPWNTTYPCSDQRCLCNPMEFEMHALCIPACGSTKLQVGSLLHQMYVKCSFGILQYPLSANHKLLWNFLDGAQTSGMLLVLQFVDNLSLVLALWGPSSCQISFVAKLVVHLQSEKLWLYHPSYGITFCLSNISIVQGEPSCSFLFGLQLEPWPSWELSILVVHCHFASVHFQRKFAMQKYISSCVFLVIPNGAAEFWQDEVLHGCEKFQWTIAWLIDFLELVTASFLQAVILYWSAHYPLSCGFELLQWEIAWLLDFSYIVVDNKLRLPVQCDPSLWRSVELIQKWMISFSLVKLQPWPSLGKYSSCMESLSESFPWYIAWSCAGSDSDGSGTLTSLRKYLGSWEELLTPTKDALHLQQANNTCHFLPPAGPPATCDTWVLLMAHGLLNALICGVLLVQSYSRLVLQVITCCPMKHSFRNLVIPRAVDTMLNKYTTCYAWRLSNVTFLQASTDSCFIRYSGLRGCELVYWKIAWPLNLVYSTCGNMSRKLFHVIKVRCEGYLQKGNAALPPFSTRTVRVCLLIYWSRFYHTENSGCNYLTSGTKSTVPFQFLASVATWTFRGLEFCHRKLPWDPGIWALLCFFGSFTRAEAKGRRSAAAPAYCHCLDHAYYVDKVRADQDYYLDVSRDQVHIGNDYYLGVFLEQVDAVPYLNLIKVRLDYGTHRDLGEVMKHQVPWDPGGSTWHRLEVKPKFKEGGMLATNPTLAWAGPKAVGLGLHRSLRRKQLHIRSECLRTRRLGKGRLRPPQLLSASSSSAPLPVMARSR